MLCPKCQHPLNEQGECDFCRQEENSGEVRVMSKEETAFYNGTTIDESTPEEEVRPENNYQRSYENPQSRIYVRSYDLRGNSSTGSKILKWLAICGAAIVIAGVVFFLAFPLLSLFLIAAFVIWILFSFFSF